MDTLLHLWKQLQSLSKLLRFAELCIMVVFLSWTSTHLPFALKISTLYCHKIITFLLSPVSIFCFLNAIVVCLSAKSGLFSGKSSNVGDNGYAVAQFYDELRFDRNADISGDPGSDDDEVVFQDKEIICEESTKLPPPLSPLASPKKSAVVGGGGDDGECEVVAKDAVVYRRSKSEKIVSRELILEEREDEEVVATAVVKEKLRRSETDVCKRSGGGKEEVTVEMTAEDGEEFRRTIEEFIAKQVRFHRQESLAVVIHGQT